MTTESELLFIAEASVRYHRRRSSFLERVSALMSAAILLGGAGAFVGLVGEATLFAKVISLGIVIVGVVQIVFQTDRCAAEHRRMFRDWNALLSEIRQNPRASPETVKLWVDRRYAIEADCVPQMRVLANDCFNRTMSALNREGDRFVITRWQRLWMQVHSFEGSAY